MNSFAFEFYSPTMYNFFSELFVILHWLNNSHKYLMVYGLFMKSLFRIFIIQNEMN